MQYNTTAGAEVTRAAGAGAPGARKCANNNCICRLVVPGPGANHVWCRAGVPVKPREFIPAVSHC